MSDRKTYNELVELAVRENVKYYKGEKTSISDPEYDGIVLRIKVMEESNPALRHPESPTIKVGADVQGTLQHPTKMYSLDNVFNTKDLNDFLYGIYNTFEIRDFIGESKIDGLSLNLIYRDNKLVRALTRGDGEYGEDVLSSVKEISDIPKETTTLVENMVEIRGEVFLKDDALKTINETQERLGKRFFYSNPRNAAVGILRSLDSPYKSFLCFSPYIYISDSCKEKSHYERLQLLVNNGFVLHQKPVHLKLSNIDALPFLDELTESFKALDDQVPKDGMVFKVDDMSRYNQLGYTSKFPRHSISFKYEEAAAITTIISVTFSVGKTGRITPVANIVPVIIGGVEVRNANIFNQAQIDAMGLRIGSTVSVVRGGEVIPDIRGVIMEGDGEPIKIPDHCPECKTRTINKLVYIVCPNQQCMGRLKRRIEDFASRKGLDIRGMGSRVIEFLVDEGIVKNLVDVLTLTREQIALVPWFKEKSIDNLASSIEKAKKVNYKTFITSISIPNVSSGTAAILALTYPEPKGLPYANRETLIALDDIGPTTAEDIVEYFRNKDNLNEYKTLCDILTISSFLNDGGRYLGKTFCLTGSFDKGKDFYKDMIESEGGSIVGSVSKKVDFLLVGDKPGSKLDKARKLNINIISIEDFQ